MVGKVVLPALMSPVIAGAVVFEYWALWRLSDLRGSRRFARAAAAVAGSLALLLAVHAAAGYAVVAR